jgi:HEAT repeat protein
MSADPSALLVELDLPDPESRRIATQKIAGVPGSQATKLLLRALGDDDWRVRKEASKVAPNVESRGDLILALVQALDEKVNIGLRNAAVEALVEIGIDSVVPAAHALAHLDADGRKLAVELLGGIPDARAIQALAAALSDEDLNVRAAAAEALGGAKPAGAAAEKLAVSALTRALLAGETLMKLAALEALVRLDARVPWAIFEPFTSDPLLRRLAIAAAGRSDEEPALLALAKACGDGSPGFATDAIVALAERLLGQPGPPQALSLARDRIVSSMHGVARVRALGAERDPRLRGSALVVLGLLRDPNDVPTLTLALQDEEVASRAESGLRLFGSGAITLALEATRASLPPVRAATLSLVPLLSDRPEASVLAALRDALRDPNVEILTAAVTSLGAAGSAEDLRALVPYATSKDSRISGTARSALQALALRNPADALALIAGIDAHGPNAAVGCVLIGAVAEGASLADSSRVDAGERPKDVAFLRAALDHGDVRVRQAAVDALSSLRDPSAGDAAAFALADEAEEVVLAAVRALGRMHRSGPLLTLLRTTRNVGVVAATLLALREASPEDTFDAARPLLSGSDAVLACAAVEAIGQLEGPRRAEGLRLALEHREPEVVKAALIELARAADEGALSRVSECIEHESFEVRRLVADLLGAEGSGASQARLRARLERETDPRVRDAIGEALSTRTILRGDAT